MVKNKPSCTKWAVHSISTGDKGPVCLPLYQLPYAYRESVIKEIKDMLENYIIEPSSSEWSAPIVIVPKKDMSQRSCVEYRRLGSISDGRTPHAKDR